MTYTYKQLKVCTIEILMACGESKKGAETVAESMLFADSRGITTHGTHLLTPIYKRVKAKQLSLPTNATVVSDSGATAIIDGGDGLGAIAGRLAADIAIEKARQFGTSTVLIKNTNNIGALAWYSEYIARNGLISIISCNAAPAMAPWGGAEQFLGTNPIAIAIYTGQDLLFSADMASTVVARGKIRKAARNGQTIPDNWAMDEDGNFTTDPNAALKGSLLPMGGPKGSAIALAADIISGMLSGASYAPNLKSFHTPEGKTGVGASIIALDISRFIPLDSFKSEMSKYIDSIKNLKKAKGFDEIYLPGEIEYNNEKISRENGIKLDDNAVAAIDNILTDIGSSFRLGE